MPKTILLEQFHLTVSAPAGLPKKESAAILRTLRGQRFQSRLHNAVRDIFRRHPSLSKVQLTLDR
jgi:hypothetical protein